MLGTVTFSSFWGVTYGQDFRWYRPCPDADGADGAPSRPPPKCGSGWRWSRRCSTPPPGAAEAIDIVVYQNIFEGLTRIDQNGAVQPGLASDWTISDDGLTYIFKLHDGVTFHDGTSFDAEDVKFTFDRILAPDSVNAHKELYEPIDSVTVIDPLTVEIKLKRADRAVPVRYRARRRGDRGAGKRRQQCHRADRHRAVQLRAMGQGQPRGAGAIRPLLGRAEVALTKASYVFISDTATMTNALLSGDIDGTNNFAAEALAVFEGNPQFKVLVGTTEGETILSTNNAKAPFNDLRVRQAMAHAIDRQAVIDGATYGYGVPIGSAFAPHNPYYVDLTGTYPYDPAKAKALLAEAGYPDGFSATLKLPPVALCAAERADHRQPVRGGRHQAGTDQRRMGAVAGRRLCQQGFRSDHHFPRGTVRHWKLCKSRLLFRLRQSPNSSR